MNLRQVLLILRLRWWLVLAIFVAVVVGTYIVSILLPKQYTAQTSLLLDVKADPLVATLSPTLASPVYMATQQEIIRSDRVASRVVKMLGLAQSPAAVSQWREATQGRIPLEAYFGELLQRGLVVEPARTSNLMVVSFTGTDPRFAAGAANAFAKAYLDLSVELKMEPARQYGVFFDERLKSLRAELDEAQKRLSDFQQKKGLVSDERLDTETAKLNATMTQLAGAQAALADTNSRQRNAGTETSPDVQQSGAVQSLKSELVRLQTRLSEVSSIVGTNHPTRVSLEAQISEVKQQLAAEMRRVSGTAATFSRVSSQTVAELSAMAEAQKRSLLALKSDRDQLNGLQRDVDTAQRTYDMVAARRSQLSVESQADPASARVLSLALEPIYHSHPNIPKNVLMSLVAGLLLGIGAAMGMEFLDRRIRSQTDLEFGDGIPLLGVISPRPGKVWHAQQRYRNQLGMSAAMPRLAHEGTVR
jgi:chain length determinant protein EpsF